MVKYYGWYENNKDLILSKYYDNNKTVSEICEELQCSRSQLSHYIRKWNVPFRKRVKPIPRFNASYNIDYKYFDNIDTEHKAYWLGMLLADGYVGDSYISLCLQIQDIQTIIDFKNDLQSEHPIKYNKDNNPYINFKCSYMKNILDSYGFNNRKSWHFDINKILEYIPNELEHHFIRGMFDGDGSIKYYKYDYLKNPQYHLGYTGLYNICQYISKKFNINSKLVHESNLTYTTKTRDSKLILKIYDYMYKDATIYMKRKYDTFQEIKRMLNNAE